MPDFASLFLKIDSTGAVTAARDLDALAAKGDKAEAATKKVTTASDAMTAGLKRMAIAAGAAFGGWKLYEMAKEAALLAARYDTLGASMRVVGNNAGYTAAQMDQYEAKLRKTGITMIESRANLTKMAQAQIDLSKSAALARIAQDSAVIGGINSSEAFERMITGIQTMNPMILRAIGLEVQFGAAEDKLAKSLGKTSEQLSATEKMQARVNAVLEVGVNIAGAYEASMSTAGKQLLSMQRYSDDLKVKLGGVFNDILIIGVQNFTGALKGANAQADKLAQDKKLEEWGRGLVYTFALLADAISFPFKVMASIFDVLLANIMAVGSAFQGVAAAARFDFKEAKMFFAEAKGLGKFTEDRIYDRFSSSNYSLAKDMFGSREANEPADKAREAASEKTRMAAAAARKEEEAAAVAAAAAAVEKEKAAKDSQKAAEESKKVSEDLARYNRDLAINMTGEWEEELARRTKAEEDAAKYSLDIADNMSAAWEAEQQRRIDADDDRLNTQLSMYENLAGYEDEYRAAQLEWIEKIRKAEIKATGDTVAANKKASASIAKIDQAAFDAKMSQTSQALGDMANTFNDIKGMYAETSSEYAKMQEAAKAMAVLQKAVAVVSAVGAIANQGLGDPYTAFARIAAMAAAMGALLGSIGASIGGGGSAAAPVKAAGTVFGDPEAVSQSTAKTLELLKDNHAEEYHELRGINDGIRDLNDSIMGLVNNIVRNGGQFNASSFGADMSGSIGWSQGQWDNIRGQFDDINLMSKLDPMLQQAFMGAFTPQAISWVHDLTSSLVGGVMGGDVEQWQAAGGIMLPASTLGRIRGGNIQGQNFATVRTEIDGGLLGDDNNYETTYFANMSADVNLMFNKVLDNMASSVVALGNAFGLTESAMSGYIFNLGAINLQGLTGEQINTTLTEYFSTLGDKAIDALIGPLLDTYRQVGEGGMETSTRLAVDMAVVKNSLAIVGQTVGDTFSPALLAATERIVELSGGLGNFVEATGTYYDKFYSDTEKQANLQANLESAFGGLGLTLPGSRSGFRGVVEGLDLLTESGQKNYVAMLQLAGVADEYYSTVEEGQDLMLSLAQENVSTLQGALSTLQSARERLTAISFGQALSGLGGINQAVAGGDYSALEGMGKYLSVLTGNTTGGYSTLEAFNADQGRATLAISALEQTTGTQLSAQEQMVNILKDVNTEIAELRAELKAANYAIAKNAGDQTNILEDWNANGMPDVRVD